MCCSLFFLLSFSLFPESLSVRPLLTHSAVIWSHTMSTGYGIFDVIRDDLVVVYLVFFFVLVHISLEILEKADVFYHYVKEIRATLNSVWQVRERERAAKAIVKMDIFVYVNQKRPSYIKAMEYSLCDAKAFHSAIEQYSHCNVENKKSPTDCGWVVVVGTRCMATVKIQTNSQIVKWKFHIIRTFRWCDCKCWSPKMLLGFKCVFVRCALPYVRGRCLRR